MALRLHTPPRLIDAMETDISPHATNPLKNKVIHATADIQIQSIETTSTSEGAVLDSSRLIEHNTPTPEDVEDHRRAAEMQSWWDEAIVRNMDLPDGYTKVAVLIVKWADELDELKTRKEAEELEAVFRDRFRFYTELIELNDVSSKPQHQMTRYLGAFLEKHDGPHNLCIVYYTGHGVFRDDSKGGYLELTASLRNQAKSGYRDARCNWNKVEKMLKEEDVECDVLTILDTCYSSNFVKSGKDESRTFELLSACAIDSTTAAPGDNSFTRALIDALKELLDLYGDRPFTTARLNQRILLDKRRHDTPSQLWFRMQHHDQHIRLAPLKPDQHRERKARGLQLPRGYLTLRFALRDASLNQEQIEYLTMVLSKAVDKKAMVGLRRIDWLSFKPVPKPHFGRAGLAMLAIAQWKKFLHRRREEKAAQRTLDNVRFPADMGAEGSRESSPTRKRTRDGFEDLPEPKREYLVIPQPPSPPVSISDSSRVEDLTV